ncbi:hypothetical protein [Bacillus sp. OxB-1]|uniref:hypothetical protein n=1 Tax=Bacillus sp. (strain OxB-1) TaxID=98228 RepID=UPI000597A15F|nr:hypothetical protein [Bacillus sp. OxB-1]
MKKPIAVIASVGILFSGLSFASPPVVNGAEMEYPVDEQGVRKEGVLTLTLDDVMERALANDRTIIILGYQFEVLKAQKEMTYDTIDELEEQKEKAESNLDSFPTNEDVIRHGILLQYQEQLDGLTYEELLPDDPLKLEIDSATQSIKYENINKNNALEEQIKQATDKIEDSIEDLKTGLKQNDISNKKLQLQVEETKEGIRYMIKGRYIDLLARKEGMDFQDKYIDKIKKDIYKAEQESDIGVASHQSVKLLKRDLKSQEMELTKTRKVYEQDLAKFLHDLGYAQTLNVEFTTPEWELEKISADQAEEIKKSFLAKSYELQKIAQDIEKLEYDKEKLAEKDKDKDENANVKYLERMNEQELNMKLEEKKKFEEETTKYLSTLFAQMDDAFELIKEKDWKKENVKEDEEKLAVQYKLGLISKHDYESSKLAYEQAEFDEYMAKIALYLKLEEISIVEKGLRLN